MTPRPPVPALSPAAAGAGPAGTVTELPCPVAVTPAAAARRPVTGSVHSTDMSIGVDGPGSRFVAFLAGCPLACLYCHNPDTRYPRNGTRMTADDLVADIARCATFLRAAGGGVTLSGGEPLLQPVFTGEVLHRCRRELDLHTALDTSGFLGSRASDALLADTDLVLLDIKSRDPATYTRVTGRDLRPTLEFARRLDRLGREAWVRFVLVPGLTDDPANVEGVARFTASLGNVTRVDVLPFHRLGAAKWEAMGIPFPLEDTPPPTVEQVEAAREIFVAHGLNTV
ncbi:pyruvate formate-lyase-activating protein [Streptomyces sp. ST2-7A]|uniref:pyruvate formate-lyase-activating protein n=1 Tax=Streptomyces sp. ST2-7A TaxID=2907214 RepID=UPI0022782C4C|nr:pyruvate formate-lyase-activating protein [Streptomyces sp. ST2-7A]